MSVNLWKKTQPIWQAGPIPSIELQTVNERRKLTESKQVSKQQAGGRQVQTRTFIISTKDVI